jgi:hypothetical protein
MHQLWASEFWDILPTIRERTDLQRRMIELLAQDTPGKATEGPSRLLSFRGIMTELSRGNLDLSEAYQEVSHQLPRRTSRHAHNNRVFASGWEERLVRTQLSRLYNQSVLETIIASGSDFCFVPHSSTENPDNPCSVILARREAQCPLVASAADRQLHSRELEHGSENPGPSSLHPRCQALAGVMWSGSGSFIGEGGRSC